MMHIALRECSAMLERHRAAPVESYMEDRDYAGRVCEMLDFKAYARGRRVSTCFCAWYYT